MEADGLELDFEEDTQTYGTDIDEYSWEFGDGETATGPDPEHRYDEPGTYNVRLTLTGEDDLSHVSTRRVEVEQPQEDTQNQAQQESETEEDEPQETDTSDSGPQTLTGQFFSQPANIGAGLSGILIAVLAALQYTGRIELKNIPEKLREPR